MTKKAFKYAMQRGLGSCVLALQNTQDIEEYRSIVLWGCARDMAYDAQCEGCRSFYLYELITQFPDETSFLDVIEKRLFQNMDSTGWEFAQLAEYYKNEKESDIRYQLLKLLANKRCAWALDVTRLIADSKSDNDDLASQAFDALCYRKDSKVREYALELLQSTMYRTDALSMFAANYEDMDKDFLINVVKQFPVTYEDSEWHWVFRDVMDIFSGSAKQKPKELLLYMYQNTLCSSCRLEIVKEMGRRRMLTKELLAQMQYDCNEDIRTYAKKKLSRSAQSLL